VWVDIDDVAGAAEVLRWRYLYRYEPPTGAPVMFEPVAWKPVSYGMYIDTLREMVEGEAVARVKDER
jgi:hypothetical protein